jgi:hypothetical protein
MNSRLERYQQSFNKFIDKLSIIHNREDENIFRNLIGEHNHFVPISLLTVNNHQQKINKIKTNNCYNMAFGIELLHVLIDIIDVEKKFAYNKHNLSLSQIHSMHSSIISMVYNSLLPNIMSSLSSHETPKIALCCNCIHEKITSLINMHNIEYPSKFSFLTHGDLFKYHFVNQSCSEKLLSVKLIPKDVIINYIISSYGSICKLALILGWILGGGSDQMITNLDRIGYHFAIMLKLSHDFSHIENDILSLHNGFSLNYVINFGLQDAFELFDDSKKKFNEGLMLLEISSPTLKEIVNIIDTHVNNIIDLSSPQLNSSIHQEEIEKLEKLEKKDKDKDKVNKKNK